MGITTGILKRIDSYIPLNTRRRKPYWDAVKGIVLGPAYLTIAAMKNYPGVSFHSSIARLFIGYLLKSLSMAPLSSSQIYHSIFSPLDSVRYFEFDYFWHRIVKLPHIGRYLDISSPRLFTARVLNHYKSVKAHIVNPDRSDLNTTAQIFRFLKLSPRCTFLNLRVDELSFSPASFDTIVSISVIEHIPGFADRDAIASLWNLLKKEGTLFLSVPCSQEAFEEHINFNEYGILQSSQDRFVFGQRFYDEALLQERIFTITGEPESYRIWAEKDKGTLRRNRYQKFDSPAYPFWKEPLFMGKYCQDYGDLAALPGWGVIAMEFKKK